MSELLGTEEPALQRQEPAPPVYFDGRFELAAHYLFGEGLEIGALHLPLAVPDDVKVRYVDRLPVAQLRHDYPELAEWNLVEADIIDDGEVLSTVADCSQDFIIANHFLEHCEDPIAAIQNHLGKLREGGILFYAVPDKRYTFDWPRPVTPLEHIIADHEGGPQRSRSDHYEEWARFVEIRSEETTEQMIARARQLERDAYSIHMHVWTQAEFLRLILAARELSDRAFDVEAAARQDIEFMVVLRKCGSLPPPRLKPQADVVPAPGLYAKVRSRLGHMARRVGLRR
jgi:SAM-dependent methyltransferase